MSGINGPQRPSNALVRAALITTVDLNQLPDLYEPEDSDDQDAQRRDSSESPEDLTEDVDELQDDLRHATADVQRLQDLIADTESEFTAQQDMCNDVRSKNARITELESENLDLLQRPTAQELDDAVHTATQPLRQTIQDNEQANRDLRNKVSQLEHQVAILEQRPTTEAVEEAIRAAKKPLADELNAAAQEIRALQTQIRELRKRPTPEEMSEAIDAAKDPLEEQIRTLNGDVQHMHTWVEELEDRPSREELDAALVAVPVIVQRELEELRQRPTQQAFDEQTNSLQNSLRIAKNTCNSLKSLAEMNEESTKSSVSRDLLQLRKQNQDLQGDVMTWKLRTERVTTESTNTKERLESDIRCLENIIAELEKEKQVEIDNISRARNTGFDTLEAEKKKARELAEAQGREHRRELWNVKAAAEEKEIELRRQLSDAQNKNIRLDQCLHDQTALADTATAKRKQIETAYSKLEQFKQSVLKQYIATDCSLTLERKSLKDCAAVLKSVTRSLYHASLQKQALLRIFLRLRDEHASMNATRKKLDHELQAIKHHQNQQETAARAQAKALENAIIEQKAYKTAAEDLEDEKGRIQDLLDQAQTEVARLTTENQDLKKGFEETLRKQKTQHDKDAEFRKTETESRENQCRKHTSELTTLRLSYSTLKQEKATLQADVLKLQKKITDTKAEAELRENKIVDAQNSIKQLTDAATEDQKTIRYLRFYEEYSSVVEESRIKLLGFIYTRLGYPSTDNSRAEFEADHGRDGGLDAHTDGRIKQCGLVFDLREQIEATALTNLEGSLRLITWLTARVQSLHKRLEAAPPCNCDEHITALTTRNAELEGDVSKLVDSLRAALDHHENTTTDQSSEIDALTRDLIKMEKAYDDLVKYVEDKIRDKKLR